MNNFKHYLTEQKMKKLSITTIALSFLALSSVSAFASTGYVFEYDNGITLYGGDVSGYSFSYPDGTTLYNLR